jgi:NAD(P)-dependent dehydrogenase (short-subunit alcohol dehydrogenase family)
VGGEGAFKMDFVPTQRWWTLEEIVCRLKESKVDDADRFSLRFSTNGIGLSLARTLYSHGAKVVITGSQQTTTDQALAYIKSGKLEDAPEDYASSFGLTFRDASSDGATTPGEVSAKVVDFKDLGALSKVAKELASEFKTLDLFLGIAGIGVKDFELTKDGFECVIFLLF